MAQKQTEEERALIIAPDLFSMIDEEELNPPQFTGNMFIGKVITIWEWEFKQSDEFGQIVLAQVSDDDNSEPVPCAFTAWRMPYYFQKILELGIATPFRVRVVADKRSYMFAPANR